MLSDSDKTANHEVRSTNCDRLHCVRFAGIRGLPAAFSGESSAAIWR
jgi:hypothetical protein